MKNNYMKPTFRIVNLQYRSQILAGSGYAKSIHSSEDIGITKKDGGFDDGDYDM